MKIRIFLFTLVILSVIIATGSVQSQGRVTYIVHFPIITASKPDIYGVQLASIDSYHGFDQALGLRVSWIGGAYIMWTDLEPERGVYRWDKMTTAETGMKNASENGIIALVSFKSTPVWARVHPETDCSAIREDAMPAFIETVKVVVARYMESPYNVRAWEFINEPDVGWNLVAPYQGWGCWGDMSQPYYNGEYYAKFFIEFYKAVKSVDLDAIVLPGGLMMEGVSRRFLDGMLEAGAYPYMTAINFHNYDYYTGVLTPDKSNFRDKLAYISTIKYIYNIPDIPLFVSEIGYICDTCKDDQLFEASKAEYLYEVYDYAKNNGIIGMLWYAMTPIFRGTELLKSDFTVLPAYIRYIGITRKLGE